MCVMSDNHLIQYNKEKACKKHYICNSFWNGWFSFQEVQVCKKETSQEYMYNTNSRSRRDHKESIAKTYLFIYQAIINFGEFHSSICSLPFIKVNF